MKLALLSVLFFLNGMVLKSYAQDQVSIPDKILQFTTDFLDKVKSRTAHLERLLVGKSQKYLRRSERKENRIKRKLARIDTSAKQDLLVNDAINYSALVEELSKPVENVRTSGEYLPYLDSVKSILAFLEQQSQFMSSAKLSPENLRKALSGVKQLQSMLQKSDKINKILQQRKEQIKSVLSKYSKLPRGISKKFEWLNKEVYYYSQQLREVRNLLNDPSRLEKEALRHLNKIPLFQAFLKEHSELAGLFSAPSDFSRSSSLSGLQTRAQVQNILQGQITAMGSNNWQQTLQSAQGQLNSIKNKLNGLGGTESEIPGFKPNNQRTKSLRNRLELGTNFQSTKANRYFPSTADIGLSIGYKLNDNNSLGIGASYKVGLGKDIHSVRMTNEGVGLRSFVDIKLKGSVYICGGFEYNYQASFKDIRELKILDTWQKSGLLGVGKIISIRSQFFKKTKLQFLWDFLSYRQTQGAKQFLFRIGYAWR